MIEVVATKLSAVTINGFDVNNVKMLLTGYANNTLRLEITDFVRSFNVANTFSITVTIDNQQQTISYTIAGMVNPLYLPPHPYSSRFSSHNVEIIIPSAVYMAMGSGYSSLAWEFFCSVETTVLHKYIGEKGIPHRKFNRRNVVPNLAEGTTGIDITFLGSDTQTILFRELECGKKYATVTWVSRTGIEKTAVWELRRGTDEVTDTLDVVTFPLVSDIANTHPIDARKGYQSLYTLHLDRLTAYDYWYYSDIVISDRVSVQCSPSDGTNTTAMRVSVVSKSVTIPDSDINAPYSLDVEIIINNYDII